MRSPLRIAVLECDDPAGEVKRVYGDFATLFRKLLEDGASQLGDDFLPEQCEFVLTPWDVVKKQQYPDLKNIDAVFLSGSSHDSFTSGTNNWIEKLVSFIQEILQHHSRIRILAICFGHQIVGRAMGVMPGRSTAGWELSVTPVTLTEKGRQIFKRPTLALHQMHRDLVPYHPTSVEPLGFTDHCHVQFIYLEHRVMSVQGHPEFDGAIADEILHRRRGSVLDEATYQDAKARVDDQHDGATVAAVFVRFLMEGVEDLSVQTRL